MSDSFSVNNGSSKKLRNINIDGCPVIGEGMHAVVYKTQPDEIVKVYRPGIAIEKIEGERKLARWAFVSGKCISRCLEDIEKAVTESW